MSCTKQEEKTMPESTANRDNPLTTDPFQQDHATLTLGKSGSGRTPSPTMIEYWRSKQREQGGDE